MPYRKIEFNKGSYYHVMNRTSSGIELFKDLEDYAVFDERMQYYAKKCDIKIIVKSLMPTHFHFLLKQDGDISLGKFIQRLSISYGRIYHKKYNYHGSLFGHRFKVKEIGDVFHMRTVSCYVCANAWKAGLVDNPLDWPGDDLALFYSDEFWLNNPDKFLLEAFHSKVGFKKQFEAYLKLGASGIIDESLRCAM